MLRLASLLVFALALAAPATLAQTPDALSDPARLDAPTAPSDEVARALATGTSVATVAYQGVLSDGGSPVADGSYTFTIGLYNDASTLLYAETHTVTTVGGAFSLAIGGGTPTSGTYDDVTFAGETSVRVTVGDTVLGPDTPLEAVPHARSLTAGAVIDGTVLRGAALEMRNRAIGSVTGVTSGVYGETTSTFSTTTGVYGKAASTRGRGVYGLASATSGQTRGVYGEAASRDGRGVYGEATAGGGTNYGVYGETASAEGSGVYGEATAGFGLSHGVVGVTRSSFGAGVVGRSDGQNSSTGVFGSTSTTSGATIGVRGETASTSGRGVYGLSTAATGLTRGASGMVLSTAGRGLDGLATAATGLTYGVYGQSQSTSGNGVYGFAPATSGATRGVYGRVGSPDGHAGYFEGGRGLYVDAGSAGHGALVLSGGGNGASTTTVFAENASTSNGIAGWFETNGTDASLVAYQRGTGDIFRAIENQNLRFRVKANGDVLADGTFTGGGADLAEYFPLADGAAVAPGQVVGLRGGRVSLATDSAEQVAVISSNPAFVGNPDAADGGALVALVGQVAVDISGDAAAGDLLVASGAADGRARAIAPSDYVPADGAVLGRVLTADGDAVIALVGVDEAAALRGVVARQADAIQALRADRDRQQAEIDALVQRLDALSPHAAR